MSQEIVTIKNLEKYYGKGEIRVCALNKVSFNVKDGEFVALMGPSGSGKTTLLNIIAGIDDPSKGDVIVQGQNLGTMSDAQKTRWRTVNIGYIFQFYNLMPVLTAYENVELPLLLLSMSRRQRHEHVMTALAAVGLSDRVKHRPNQLSGGQQQRVAIARALVADAKILICDEPTGNLDAKSETEIMGILTQLNNDFDKTIIMVTHDTAAAAFAKRTVHLEKGSIVNHEKEQGNNAPAAADV